MSFICQIRGWLECSQEARHELISTLEKLDEERDVNKQSLSAKVWSFAAGPQRFCEYLFCAADVPGGLVIDFERHLQHFLSLSFDLSGFFYIQTEDGEVTWWYRVSHDVLSKEEHGPLYDNFVH